MCLYKTLKCWCPVVLDQGTMFLLVSDSLYLHEHVVTVLCQRLANVLLFCVCVCVCVACLFVCCVISRFTRERHSIMRHQQPRSSVNSWLRRGDNEPDIG